MTETYGLTHLALAVRDVEGALRFYNRVFGVEAYAREPGRIHAKTPGRHDVITFDESLPHPGISGGIVHFGFRLTAPEHIDALVSRVEDAGGTVRRRGEFRPGLPYAYVTDPDGYEVEIWYE